MVLTRVLVLSRSNPRRMVYTVAVAATVNIGLNFALIPGLGDVGSALAMLSSMVVYTSIALWLAVLEVGRISWASMLAAPGVAAIAMAAALVLLGCTWPLAIDRRHRDLPRRLRGRRPRRGSRRIPLRPRPGPAAAAHRRPGAQRSAVVSRGTWRHGRER